MKTALTPEGKRIAACSTAPAEAVCPSCGGTLVLRQRQRMSENGASYFWRHKRNSNRHCRARFQFTPSIAVANRA